MACTVTENGVAYVTLASIYASIDVSVLPNGGNLSFALVCTVTATCFKNSQTTFLLISRRGACLLRPLLVLLVEAGAASRRPYDYMYA